MTGKIINFVKIDILSSGLAYRTLMDCFDRIQLLKERESRFSPESIDFSKNATVFLF
jgi:hypothetical protein